MINDKRKALGRGLESLLPGRPVPIPQPAAAMPVPNPQGDPGDGLRQGAG